MAEMGVRPAWIQLYSKVEIYDPLRRTVEYSLWGKNILNSILH